MLLLYGFGGCLLSVATAAQATQSPPPRGDVERGRTVFVKDGCYQCHGREGQGSPSTGSRLAGTRMTLAAFTAYVRRPRGEMPPYTAAILTDAELADMYVFVTSRPRPGAPPPAAGETP